MGWSAVTLLAAILVLPGIFCPPVTKAPPSTEKPNIDPAEQENVELGLEYERYLKEVVNVLETDDIFKKKLEESNISDIKSGEIARHLEFVSHNVRTKLDELKRTELDRVRQLQRMKMRAQNGIKNFDPHKILGHMDHNNPTSFEIEDLAKLIKKATGDLEDLDKKRKEEFKVYEMEKEHLKREKLNGLKDDEKKKVEQELEDQKKKHKEHPKMHHPGSKDQLEEVWEESDGLDKDDFDPKTFFHLHDSDGDGYLDEREVEALFQNELDKAYDPDAPEDDMMERYEEMNRMREHVINEVDKDKDKRISLDEFLESTKKDEFEKDEGWEGLDEADDFFTEEELANFEKQYEEQQRQQHHAQPGEVQDHLQQQGGHPQGVNQMNQRGQDSNAIGQQQQQGQQLHFQQQQQPPQQQQQFHQQQQFQQPQFNQQQQQQPPQFHQQQQFQQPQFQQQQFQQQQQLNQQQQFNQGQQPPQGQVPQQQQPPVQQQQPPVQQQQPPVQQQQPPVQQQGSVNQQQPPVQQQQGSVNQQQQPQASNVAQGSQQQQQQQPGVQSQP